MTNLIGYHQFLEQRSEIDAEKSFREIMKKNVALCTLIEQSPSVGYIFNYKTLKYNYLNQNAFMRLLRLPDAYHYNKLMEEGVTYAHSRLHPSDATIIQNNCFSHLLDTIKKIDPALLEKVRFSYNYRAKYGNDDSYGHFLSQFCIIPDPSYGEPIFNVGILIDISHLKRDNKIVFSANFYDEKTGLKDFQHEFWPEGEGNIHISERELEIVKLLAQGRKVEQIAETLFISPFTVRAHKRNLFEKMEVKKTAELVAKLSKEGYLD